MGRVIWREPAACPECGETARTYVHGKNEADRRFASHDDGTRVECTNTFALVMGPDLPHRVRSYRRALQGARDAAGRGMPGAQRAHETYAAEILAAMTEDERALAR